MAAAPSSSSPTPTATGPASAAATPTAYYGTYHMPAEHTYRLPDGFRSEFGNSMALGTTCSNVTVMGCMSSSARAVAVAYDQEFAKVIGPDATAEVLVDQPGSGAFEEAGVWVPSHDEVWFTSTFANYPNPGTTTAYHISKRTTRTISGITYGAGGYLHKGAVYTGGLSPHPGIQVTDPTTGATSVVLNSVMGQPFSLADDLVWITDAASGKDYCYFTAFYTVLFPDVQGPTPPQPFTLPNGVWRWDPQEQVVLPVIGRTDVGIPNGIRASPDGKTLYVTESLSTKSGGAALGNQGFAVNAAPYIWAFDLDANMLPVGKRLLGVARAGYPDGIHIDDHGRIWTAEGDGIHVRAPSGKILALFNAAAFGVDPAGMHQIANFALAGDTLYVGAVDKLYAVKLAQVVATESR